MAFGALKQGLKHQRYKAKSSNKNLTILFDSAESEVLSLTVIAALLLSATGFDLETRPIRIIDTK